MSKMPKARRADIMIDPFLTRLFSILQYLLEARLISMRQVTSHPSRSLKAKRSLHSSTSSPWVADTLYVFPQVAIHVSLSSITPIGVYRALPENWVNHCQLLTMHNSSSSPNSTAQNSRIFRMSIWLSLWYANPELQNPPEVWKQKEQAGQRLYLYTQGPKRGPWRPSPHLRSKNGWLY